MATLVIDEMAIRKKLVWNGLRYVGYEDLGNGIRDDNAPLAREALVFMIVYLKKTWKLPVGYCLINSMDASSRTSMVTLAIQKLYDVRVRIACLTCDGPAVNRQMLKQLGATIDDPHSMEPWFAHPSDASKRVCTLLDPCHQIELMRNHFATVAYFLDDNNEKVSWSYIEELHKIQEDVGWRFGNKVSGKHMQWERMKMKVSPAVQVFSRSVADALDLLRIDLEMPQFQESAPTSRFIRIINDLFDLCNSRTPVALEYEAALIPQKRHYWEEVLVYTYDYLTQLKSEKGIFLHKTKMGTCIFGFLMAMNCMVALHDDLVVKGHLPHLSMYRTSQDHLEMWFGIVRSRLGCNNNPDSFMFQVIYKRLLVQHELMPKHSGNCIPIDSTRLLLAVAQEQRRSKEFIDPLDDTFIKQFNLDQERPDLPIVLDIGEGKRVAVTYVTGYVLSMVESNLACEKCKAALSGTSTSALRSPALIIRKNRGGLKIPSPDLEFVCHEAELVFTQILAANNWKLPLQVGLNFYIGKAVLKNCFEKCL